MSDALADLSKQVHKLIVGQRIEIALLVVVAVAVLAPFVAASKG